MKRAFPFLALAIATPVAAQDAITPELAVQVRCAAAFAVVAGDQARGDPEALAYPALKQRGGEYFVRTGAHLMDALHLTREQMSARLEAEAAAQRAAKAAAADPKAYTDGVLGSCLAGLEASGL